MEKTFKLSLLFACTVGIGFSSLIIFFALDIPAQGANAKPVVSIALQKQTISLTARPAGAGLSNKPARIKIPQIKVDTSIESLGLTPKGAVAVTKGPYSVAWFNLGTRPGDVGSAVISGHSGPWKNGIPTIFNNLSKLNIGDKLSVIDEKGSETKFVVREFRSYGENETAPDVFVSIDGKSHLNLVTCEGVWNKTTKSYSQRLVVFTDKE